MLREEGKGGPTPAILRLGVQGSPGGLVRLWVLSEQVWGRAPERCPGDAQAAALSATLFEKQGSIP